MQYNEKRPYNEHEQHHGYWEVYYDNGQLHFKGLFINNRAHGSYESYSEDGSLVLKCITFNKKIYGHCIHLNQIIYYAI